MADGKPLNLLEASKLPGIADLPLKVRGKFAKALLMELEGQHDKAEQLLNEAVELETAHWQGK